MDYFGIKILCDHVKHLQGYGGKRLASPPFPGDGFRAGFIEYLAIIDSIEDAESFYQFAEIGASYGPFTALAGVLSTRKNLVPILRAVEASQINAGSVLENLQLNGISDNIDFRLFNAAVIGYYKKCYFPRVDCTADNGAAPQDAISERDVRGAILPMDEIDGIPLSYVINSFSSERPIDLLHIDIQGSEKIAIPMDIMVLKRRVKRIFLATHSREIEGKMFEILSANGFILLAESPCEFSWRNDVSAPEGMTTNDGSQYWINRFL